jgi:hypothetical protein
MGYVMEELYLWLVISSTMDGMLWHISGLLSE